MTLILGLDPAQVTGIALYDTARSLSAIQVNTFKAAGDCFEEKGGSIGRQLFGLIRSLERDGRRPALIAMEAPLRQKVGIKRKTTFMGQAGDDEPAADGGGLNAVISSNQITGAIMCVVAVKDIPFVILSSSTWRKAFLGFGTHKGWTRDDWKKAVRQQCAREKIAVTNNDQADAVGIAIAAKNTDTFRHIEYERSRQVAA
ncbi:RuvC family protein [Aureimonas psammosilenae]|uniref:hypothetical protein n=1 Tax=Aureimonas psammosilenae TaxID=2495496 RepID=UPI001869D77F|nr:hypothetical protein [Aureimonas psammosilenae]